MEEGRRSADFSDARLERYLLHGPPIPVEWWDLRIPCPWGPTGETFEVLPDPVLEGRPGGGAIWTFLTFSRPTGFLAPLCILWWPPHRGPSRDTLFVVVPLIKLVAVVSARRLARLPLACEPALEMYRVRPLAVRCSRREFRRAALVAAPI